MKGNYYQIPIQFSLLKSKNKELPSCGLQHSIAQNIYMIITSGFQEHRFDNTFGCELWEVDFELITNENLWLEKVRRSILGSVGKYEQRLDDLVVNLKILQETQDSRYNSTKSIKKKLEIKVEGKILQTGEPYYSSMNIYLSPLSLD